MLHPRSESVLQSSFLTSMLVHQSTISVRPSLTLMRSAVLSLSSFRILSECQSQIVCGIKTSKVACKSKTHVNAKFRCFIHFFHYIILPTLLRSFEMGVTKLLFSDSPWELAFQPLLSSESFALLNSLFCVPKVLDRLNENLLILLL